MDLWSAPTHNSSLEPMWKQCSPFCRRWARNKRLPASIALSSQPGHRKHFKALRSKQPSIIKIRCPLLATQFPDSLHFSPYWSTSSCSHTSLSLLSITLTSAPCIPSHPPELGQPLTAEADWDQLFSFYQQKSCTFFKCQIILLQ